MSHTIAPALGEVTIQEFRKVHQPAPDPQCEIHMQQMGGAVGRVAGGATAFPERSVPFVVNAVTGWHDPTVASTHSESARAVADAPGEATYSSLAAVKNGHYPTKVLRLNHSVEPTTGS